MSTPHLGSSILAGGVTFPRAQRSSGRCPTRSFRSEDSRSTRSMVQAPESVTPRRPSPQRARTVGRPSSARCQTSGLDRYRNLSCRLLHVAADKTVLSGTWFSDRVGHFRSRTYGPRRIGWAGTGADRRQVCRDGKRRVRPPRHWRSISSWRRTGLARRNGTSQARVRDLAV